MDDVLVVVGLVLALLVVAGLLAPFESLGWWAGWFGRRDELEREVARASAAGRRAGAGRAPGARYYLVFLSGVGTISGEDLLPFERHFLDDLRAGLPEGGVVTHVFPYSAEGVSLTNQRFLAWFWRRIYRVKVGNRRALTSLVYLRNVTQVLVSADSRYGPVFNYGLSRQMLKALLRAGYETTERRPVFLLGYSGGGQMAVGSATYLKSTLAAPVEVISLGGIISSDPGLGRVDHVARIYGTIDSIHGVGEWLLPPRWPHQLDPRWNRAKREGRITLLPIGRIRHLGFGSYLDSKAVLETGETPRQRSIATIGRVVEQRLAAHAGSADAGAGRAAGRHGTASPAADGPA